MPATPREFALLPGRCWRERGPDDPRAWTATLVPAKLWRVATYDGTGDFETGLADYFGSLRGKAKDDVRDVLYHWPAIVGLTVARRLLERGRIFRAVVDAPHTAKKLRTLKPPDWDEARWLAWIDEHAIYTDGSSWI